ncbi:unknown similar to AMEV070 [Adoxophyes honmai entomopoxvirus 'L']|uniref:Uncharacterized protein n=1 Tax=Adoxophyes honmai entomopoxvirus 'L' TaxID=1293540 RepID=A0A916KNZ4_9POXV|nr:unknown similar to AMEV070 [Adoxophyes honmai entomopoxvirus 'L']CCU55386.1 unknown similar to AMEV070 [Adoxophyes honmai entomopoxvirus 'L']
MIKYILLINVIIFHTYLIIQQKNNDNYAMKVLYLKDKLYFNNIINVTNFDNWVNLLNELHIKISNNTLLDLINYKNTYKSQNLLRKISKNKFKYVNRIIKCNKKIIYWNYKNIDDVDNNLIIQSANKSFNAWNKRINKCVEFKFTTKIDRNNLNIIIKPYNKYTTNKNILASYNDSIKSIILDYNYIQYDERYLIILIMHEIGHSLGVSHINNKYSVMNKYHNLNLYKYINLADPSNILHYFDVQQIIY